MKKCTIIFILLIALILSGCSKEIVADVTISTIVETTVTETTVNNDYINLKVENDRLVTENNKLKADNEAYSYLLNNLNSLLKNVYYGYASNDKYILDGFTAFSIYYKDKYYLITAGHCVESGEVGKMTSFKFKANFLDEWIYPKLLTYENDFYNDKDYAVFYSDKISDGFIKYSNNIEGKKYILGSINNKLNVFREYSGNGIPGESGSPAININQEVVGIYNNRFTNIQVVLNKIDGSI